MKVPRGPAAVREESCLIATFRCLIASGGEGWKDDDAQARRPACFFAPQTLRAMEGVFAVAYSNVILCKPLGSDSPRGFLSMYRIKIYKGNTEGGARMLENIQIIHPADIEKRSFEILTEILGERRFPPLHESVIKRVIHTTADFEYADILKIGEGAVEAGMEALQAGMNIVTDTQMAAAGINKRTLKGFGGEVLCFMSDEDVAAEAKEKNITRASVCMEKAAASPSIGIYVVGNAPTALIRLYELIKAGVAAPKLIVGVPVGFVNVVESKELIKAAGIPTIISEGRKGGSNVAAAIVNAMLYMAAGDRRE